MLQTVERPAAFHPKHEVTLVHYLTKTNGPVSTTSTWRKGRREREREKGGWG